MDLEYSEEEQYLGEVIRNYIDDHELSRPRAFDVSTIVEFGNRFRTMIADLDLFSVCIAEPDSRSLVVAQSVVMREIGRALIPFPALSAMLAVTAVERWASADQRNRLLPDMLRGASLALASLSSYRRRQRVIFDAESGTLTGQTSVRSFGISADFFIVPASVVGHDCDEGQTSYFVARSAHPGLRVEPVSLDEASRSMERLTFKQVDVEPLGPSSRSADQAEEYEALGLALLANESIAAASACTEMATSYAKLRHQFGRPIGSFQAVKHLCAEMAVAIELAEPATLLAARALENSMTEAIEWATIAQAEASDSFQLCALNNMQVHGGIGFTWEHPVHLYLRRAMINRAMLGTPAELRARIAAMALRQN